MSTISAPMFVKNTTEEKGLYFDGAPYDSHKIFGFPLKQALERGGNMPNREIPSIVSGSIEFLTKNGKNNKIYIKI